MAISIVMNPQNSALYRKAKAPLKKEPPMEKKEAGGKRESTEKVAIFRDKSVSMKQMSDEERLAFFRGNFETFEVLTGNAAEGKQTRPVCSINRVVVLSDNTKQNAKQAKVLCFPAFLGPIKVYLIDSDDKKLKFPRKIRHVFDCKGRLKMADEDGFCRMIVGDTISVWLYEETSEIFVKIKNEKKAKKSDSVQNIGGCVSLQKTDSDKKVEKNSAPEWKRQRNEQSAERILTFEKNAEKIDVLTKGSDVVLVGFAMVSGCPNVSLFKSFHPAETSGIKSAYVNHVDENFCSLQSGEFVRFQMPPYVKYLAKFQKEVKILDDSGLLGVIHGDIIEIAFCAPHKNSKCGKKRELLIRVMHKNASEDRGGIQ